MSPSPPPLGARGLRTLAHPLRLRLLSLLTGTAMSAAEAARELGETQANVSYHLRRLRDAGLVEVCEEVEVRGGRARRYRHAPESGERIDIRDPGEHRLLASAMAEEMRRRAARQRPGTRSTLTDADLWIDPTSWQNLRERVGSLMSELHEAARPPHTPGTVHVSTSLLMFEMDDTPPPPPARDRE
ncbi:ArsR/SmtB family transcription factor [Marinactinospora thermotolerans]|uniref:Transcriptional regulator, ArsR family n=1 Tax=Marinactinospora thermotolerans DSM 45154 TaxID=1122192 RepID=A0A1T4SHB3_9ACTN|nr:helix-turn-helix domain-containing protein [Marinactinospora thermotolerans]SKA27338.1 transcriptional regulator, ArsR family [Marinactinospora thermotolerans DSM 45154]